VFSGHSVGALTKGLVDLYKGGELSMNDIRERLGLTSSYAA